MAKWSDSQKRYQKSDRGKQAHLRYQQSEKGKATHKAYLARRKAKLTETKQTKVIIKDIPKTNLEAIKSKKFGKE